MLQSVYVSVRLSVSVHLSVCLSVCCGQLFRSVAAGASALGLKIQPYLDEGRPGNSTHAHTQTHMHAQTDMSNEREG